MDEIEAECCWECGATLEEGEDDLCDECIATADDEEGSLYPMLSDEAKEYGRG